MESSKIFRLKKDDQKYFEEVFYTYNKRLYSYFRKKIPDDSLCEDLIQETFARLWKYRRSLDESLSIEIQIFRIAKTAFIDMIRQQSGNNTTYMDDETTFENHYHITEDHFEVKQQVACLIKNLPRERKKIIDLKLNGYSNKEIADLMSIKIKTVENNINMAFRQMRKNSNK